MVDLIKEEDGVTLIEILIAASFIALVMTLASTMIIQSFNIFRGSTYRMSAGQMAELSTDEIALKLREAEKICEEIKNGEPLEVPGETYTIDLPEDEINIIRRNNPGEPGDRLVINSEDGSRGLAYGIESFRIRKENQTDFIIEIEYIDDDKVSRQKSLSVTSRNLN